MTKEILLACFIPFFGLTVVAQDRPKFKHKVAADFGKRMTCPDGHRTLVDVPTVWGLVAPNYNTVAGGGTDHELHPEKQARRDVVLDGTIPPPNEPTTQVECKECGFEYIPSVRPRGAPEVVSWFKFKEDPQAFKWGLGKFPMGLPKLAVASGSLGYSQSIGDSGNVIRETASYKTTLPITELVPALKDWLAREGIAPGKIEASQVRQGNQEVFAIEDRGVLVQIIDSNQQDSELCVQLSVDGTVPDAQASDFKQCPEGHPSLHDVPIVYGLRPPRFYEHLEDFPEKDRELIDRSIKREIFLGGNGSGKNAPKTRVFCKECGYEFHPSNAPDLRPGLWFKREKSAESFKHAFSELLSGFPKLGVAKNSLKYSQYFSGKEEKVLRELVSYETSLPPEKIIPPIKDWLKENGFNPDAGSAASFTRFPSTTSSVYYNEDREVWVEIGTVDEKRGLYVMFEQRF